MKYLRILLLSFLLLIVHMHPKHISGQSPIHTQIEYLSGTGKDDLVNWEFYCSAGRNSQQWTTIGVPSCWEQQGFGTYNYGHDPWEARGTEYGLYKHTFEVPQEWQDRAVNLVFEGVMTDAEVKINGKLAGEVHQGAFYEFKYSITDLLAFGQDNLLEVKVNKVSANESVNYAERKADFWIFGGIYRPVYLEILPTAHIQRVAVDAKASGAIKTDLLIDAPTATTLQLRLQDLAGNPIQILPLLSLTQTQEKWSFTSQATDIHAWSPEHPHLYQLVIELTDGQGKILHTISQRMGFRTVVLRAGDGIYVNDQRIKFKGVNRHSFHPASGRTTSKAWSIQQASMIKDMNMNAVRMSHYPPDVHFLDVCDSMGLFVIDEVCTWHSPHLDTEVGRKIVRETVVRDVNHPCILLWANGNETGWNTALDDDYAIWDIQGREVIHPWNMFRKTNTLHYMYYHGLINDTYGQDKIFFPTEFLHGIYDGGHGAGLADYWNMMWQAPLCAGGFLWCLADEGLMRTDQDNRIDTDGNHAADGILGPFGEKEASYFTIKEIWAPIQVEDRYIHPDFNGIFRIENRYHFTNLEECTMKARWINYAGPHGELEPKVLIEQDIKLPPLPPGGKGNVEVELPTNWQAADALHLTTFDPYGKETYTWTYPVKAPLVLNQAFLSDQGGEKITTTIQDQEIHIAVNELAFTFSHQTGLLERVTKDGRLIPLSNGPILLGRQDKMDTVWVKTSSEQVEIHALFEKTDKFQEWVAHEELSSDQIIWTIYPNGALDLIVKMKGKKKVTGYKGISFSYPEAEVAGMKWLGGGRYRVWRNRRKGTQFQVWENDYNNTVTGESGFAYPEFKGFFSELYWAKIRGQHENGFTVYCHSPHTYFRVLTPANPSGDERGRVSVDFPPGDFSFLKNIPPIGTKFQEPRLMGPSSNPENFFGNDDDPLVFNITFEF